MRILQKFGFRDSAYERPQDRWVCGRLAEGKPCSLGPGAKGQCRVTAACQPHRDGDRWECRRSQQDGGPCDAGPLPGGRCCIQLERCVPQPSLRATRRRVSLWAACLVVGLAVVGLSGSQASRFLMPGPLSAHHASQSECSSCHAGVAPDNLGWLHRAVTAAAPEDNAKLCITCHGVGDTPFTPHTHPVEELRAMTQALQARGPKDESWPHRISFPAPQNTSASGDAQIFCATCHEEHQGIANLTAVGNDRCQTCHVSKFGAFATSHPQFTEYPFNRRTRIIFDHKSHFGIHFPKTAEAPAPGQTVPGVCTDCHEPGPGRRYMEIGSFESMCTSCHNGDILGTTRAMGPKGIDFLGVPGLDVATLTARGVDIGVWPDAAEAGMTAFLKTLLLGGGAHDGSGDIREAIAAADSLDLLDLREASDADLARIAELAWSVKRLFNRLETTPLSEVITLPGDAMGTDMDRMQMAWMTGLLPHDVIRAANRDWFPGLGEELQRHAGGAPTQAFEDARAALEPAATPVAGTGDAANNVPANEAPSDDILGNDASATGDDILGGADDAILGGDTSSPGEPADAGLDLLGLPAGADVPAETPASADDILGGNDSILGGGDDAGGDILGGDDILSADAQAADGGLDALLGGDTPDPDLEPARDQQVDTAAEPFDPESWAEFGGWYRQDFTIRYRPSGHADRFLRAWLDYSGAAFGTPMQPAFAPVFEQLAPESAVGRCTKCHSVDDEDGRKHVKWRGFSTGRVSGRFTRFSHEPHVSAVGPQGCIACHALTETAPASQGNAFLKTYLGGDPAAFVPNFKNPDKALCATCHTESKAGESCTLCHSYHTTDLDRPMSGTRLPK